MIFYHIRINQLWMILITFVHLLTFVVIFDESTLLVNKICKILFSEFFCEKKQDFCHLEYNFQRVKTLRGLQKLLMNTRFRPIAYHFVKKHDQLKTLHLSTSSFTKYCLHSRFCTSIIFFELLHQCNYQGIKSTFKSTF